MAAVLAVTTVAALTAAAPASAAPASFTLDMIGGQGQVVLGKSPDAPLVLATPSTIRGTVDDQTGAVTAGTLSTPPIHFTQQITSPITADVDITATFSDTTPNSGTGAVDGLGNVSFSTSLNLDLHIEVAGGVITGDCASAPIALNLVSVAPYDPELGEVTLIDQAFAIPAAPVNAACPSIIADAINDQLSSPSNSISLGMVGALTLPPPPGEPSTTALSSNAAATPMGHPATFTAAITPAVATGSVTFLSGTSSIGIAAVGEGGVATLTTSSLPLGTHQITARYSGDIDHRPSTSPTLEHTVTAIPNITADMPSQVLVGAAPTEFTTTISNPSSGGAQTGLRLDMLFGRVGTATSFTNAMFTLEHKVGEAWVSVPLARRTLPAPADLTGTLAGSYPDATGFALAPGETREITFRITAAANATQGIMAVQFKLNTVDGGGAVTATFSTTNASVLIGTGSRRSTSVVITTGAGAVIRQGFALRVQATVTRGGATPLPNIAGGHIQVLIDDQPVVASPNALTAPTLTVPPSATGAVTVEVPASATQGLRPGEHQLSVRFLGDPLYRASLSPDVAFTVHPQGGVVYECKMDLGIAAVELGARIEAHANLPAAAPAGTTLSVSGLDVVAVTELNPFGPPLAQLVDMFNAASSDPDLTTSVVDLSPAGATSRFGEMAVGTPSVAPSPLEFEVAPVAPEAEFPIVGQPGDVIDVRLDRFGFRVVEAGATNWFLCTPVDEAASLGSVTVAGTTLSSSAVGVVEEGSAVSLSASVFPSSAQGMVEFFDGATSIGFAPVSAGVAVLPTTGLPQGRRSVSARYLGDLVNAPSTSEAVEVSVRDVILCRNQTGTESGSTVRATYLSLLGRCAEPSGFAFWRGRLDAGLSAEVFAGQIANTLEAHGRSVDDGYRLALGRNADSAGRAFWAQRLNGGQRYDLLLGDLAASNEFWTAAGSTNSGFVTRLYDRLLHRAPDASGLAYWVGRLDAGASRASVAASFVRLPEPSGQIVVDAYEAILDRSPTAGEKAPAVAAFQGSGHRWKVYAGLIGTTEFHDRAQGHPNS